ncbi:MAG: M61 family metallopeptidase [Brasilonema angustatum HA4187-MV1]|jgi:predicted metalloprotease with PDZ domain|nr:M61 family metallopeptidase [Brasilonema angustatum HA4187-MV1]
MTEATAPRTNIYTKETAPAIHYQVTMPKPETHLFEVSLRLVDYSLPTLDLKLPVWTPGSYLVREYAKHLQDFAAFAHDKPLSWHKISKNHWQVETSDVSEIIIHYRIFANELSVRTNHLDSSHGYFNGAALFFRILAWEGQPIQVTVVPPHREWQVTTALPSVPHKTNTFCASDFDTLVDSPFEIGLHQLHHFEVLGKSHELAIWGKGNFQLQQMITDIEKIIEVEARMFGGLPYQRYVFLLHLFAQAYGGLEHKNSCTLIYQRLGFRDRDKYERFLQLVAHEFFHLWNVKRIRPKALEVFDYDQENYTSSLWFCEGTTSYYDLLIPLRAGIYDAKSFLNNLSKEIARHETTPGRKVQSLAESSFDAWIKLYRPDANSGNSQISYYLKGEMVSLLLDLLIRSRSRNQRSLDDVMLKMWHQFGTDEIGYTSEQLQSVIEYIAGIDLTNFFNSYIDKTEDLPFNEYLEPFGLQLVEEKGEEPYLGVKVNSDNGRELIKFVDAGSPAQFAGIDPGDELLAIDGLRIAANGLGDRLKDYQPKDIIQVTIFHQDELRTLPVTLASPRVSKYQIKPVKNPSTTQKENFAGWLGTPLTTLY